MNIVEKLLYLDAEYISNMYESITNTAPSIKISKSEGLNAGVKVPLFSAGANVVETKSYNLSTNAMFNEIQQQLDKKPTFNSTEHNVGQPSTHCWVEGNMSVSWVVLKRNRYTLTLIGIPKEPNTSSEEVLSEESYFHINDDNGQTFALLATGNYFSSGIKSIVELSKTVTTDTLIPVRALLRVLPIKNKMNQWVAVPLVVLENHKKSQ